MTIPCPECGSRSGYEDVGPYRTMCVACGALLKHTETRPGQTATPPVVVPKNQPTIPRGYVPTSQHRREIDAKNQPDPPQGESPA